MIHNDLLILIQNYQLSVDKFKFAANQLNDAIVLYNENNQVLFINNSFKTVFEHPKRSFLTNPSILFEWINNKDRKKVEKWLEIRRKQFRTEVFNIQFNIITAKAKTKKILYREQSFIDSTSLGILYLAVFTDISKFETDNSLTPNEELIKEIIQLRTKKIIFLEEEYLTLNEELQQLNEEYAALNEELKATNEELFTTNEVLKKEIIEHQKTQQHLSESENKFRSFLEQSSEGISLVDEKGKIIEWNQALEKITGIKRKKIVGKNLWEAEYDSLTNERKTPKALQNIKNTISNYLKQGENAPVFSREGEIEPTKGNKIYVRLTAFPIKTEKGIIIGRIIQDITDKKEKELKLAEYQNNLEKLVKERTELLNKTQNKYKNLFEQAVDGIILYNNNGLIEEINPILSELTGFSKNQLLKRNICSLFKNDLYENALLEHFCKNEIHIIQLNLKTKQNNDIPVEIKTKQIDENNNIAIIRDITERLNAEQKEKEKLEIIEKIRNGTSSSMGKDFFNDVVLYLADSLHANYTFIGKYDDSKEEISIISFNQEGEIVPGFTYSIHGTPCAEAIEHNTCVHSDNVASLYPDDHILAKMNIKGYVGVKLQNTEQKTLGVLVALFKNPIHDPIFTENILKIFSVRTATEFERLNYIEKIQQAANIFENIQVGMYIYHLVDINDDRTLLMVAANEAAATLTGVAVKDILGKTLDENFPGLREQGIPQMFANVIRTQKAIDTDTVFYGDNRVIASVFSIKAFPLPDNHVGISFENISERLQANEALKDSEAKYKAIVDSFDGIIYICSQDYKVEFMNETLIKRTGRNAIGEPCYKALHDLSEICPWCINDKIFKGETIKWEIQSPKDKRWYYVINTPIYHTDGSMSKQSMIMDITERKIAENNLIESEQKFKTLFNYAADIIFIHLIDGKIIDINETAYNILQYNKEELNYLELAHFDILAQENYSNIKQKLEKDKAAFYETQYKTKNGTVFPVEVNSRLIEYQGNLAVLSIVRDISERKKAEIALLRSEDKYKLLSEITTDAASSLIIQPDGSFKREWATEQLIKTYGYTMDDIDSFEKWMRIIHPEDIPAFIQSKEKLMKGEKVSIELRIITSTGEIKWINNTVFPQFDTETKQVRLLSALKDITDKKNAEQALLEEQSLYIAGPVVVIKRKNLQGFPLEYASPNIKQEFGYDACDLIKNDFKYLSIIHPSDINHFQESLLNIKLTSKDWFEIEYRLFKASGEICWVNDFTKVIKDNTGNILYTHGYIEDITERKQIERKILDAVIEAEEKERQRLAQDLHDEIGPILSSLKMYISTLSISNEKEKTLYIIDQVKELIKQSVSTVREISNALSPHVLNNFGLHSAIKTAIDNVSTLLEIDYQSNLGTTRFNQNVEIVYYRVFKELLNNTLKHSEATLSKIRVKFENNYLTLDYSDNGKGFDFEKEIKENKSGMGLFNILNRIKTINGTYQFKKQNEGFAFELRTEIEISNI
jgi:PAS domain S-box-containing protein